MSLDFDWPMIGWVRLGSSIFMFCHVVSENNRGTLFSDYATLIPSPLLKTRKPDFLRLLWVYKSNVTCWFLSVINIELVFMGFV